MSQTLPEIIAANKAVRDSQRVLINQQKAALPGQEQAAVGGLETAKTNAFGDIVNAANARGVVYSGAPIQEQQRYVGERYLPALASLKADFANRGSKLDQAMLGIDQDEMTTAQHIQAEQQRAEAEQARAEAEAAYKQEQLQLQRQRIAISQQRASAPRKPNRQDEIYSSFQDDLRGAFNGFGARPTFFTEKNIIPQLQAAYPELSPDKIQQLVYAYRKANFGS